MIGRRGALAMIGMGGLPPRRLDQAFRPPGYPVAPGASNKIRARQLVIGKFQTISPSGDTTGNADAVTINNGLAGGGSVLLTTGTYYINATLTCSADSSLTGSGPGTIVQPVTGFTGPMVSIAGSDVLVGSLQFYGGTGTRSANPAADVISVAPGVSRWWLNLIMARFCNGRVLNATGLTGAAHGIIGDIFATNCAAGLDIESAIARPAQINMANLDIQQCETGDGIKLVNVQDILIANANVACFGAQGIPFHVAGGCASVYLTNPDLGQFPNTGGNVPTQPTVLVETSGGNSPNDIRIIGGVIQRGLNGLQVTGAANRVEVLGSRIAFCQRAAVRHTGTGFGHLISNCMFSSNNQAADITASEIEWTSTAAGQVVHNRFDTNVGASSTNFSGAGTQVCDYNWFGGDPPFTTGNQPVYVRNNIGYNPVGPITVGVPASGNFTAPRPFDCTAQLVAAAGSGVTISVQLSSGQYSVFNVAAGGQQTFFVPATANVQLTYTAAPTWAWAGN